jgi:hypothetical protein
MLTMTALAGLGTTATQDYNTCILDGGDADVCAALHPEGAAQQAQRADPWAAQSMGPLTPAPSSSEASWAPQSLGPLTPAGSAPSRAPSSSGPSGKTIAVVLAGIGLVGLVAFGIHRHHATTT